MSSFLHDYIDFITEYTETQNLVHVWSILTSVSALLGRSRYVPFGSKKIYSNFYTMIVGDPGSRKSSAIKEAKKLCREAGYEEYAFESGSKESYFSSLARKNNPQEIGFDLDRKVSINGKEIWEPPMGETHSFICSDEFDTFIGLHNMPFISALGDLWDREDDFRYETIKHGIVVIYKPYITILGGTTPSSFSAMFPASALDHGFLSRMLLIPCQGLGKKLSLPPDPNPTKKEKIVNKLETLLNSEPIQLERTKEFEKIYTQLYHEWHSPFDARFAGYAARRHMHLLKLSIIFSALNESSKVGEDEIIKANTLLTYTELLMPDVIGEMGKGPHTVAMNLIINTLSSKPKGLSLVELYKLLYREVRSMDELNSVLNLLRMAQRIVTDEEGNHHFIPSAIEIPKAMEKFMDKSSISFL